MRVLHQLLVVLSLVALVTVRSDDEPPSLEPCDNEINIQTQCLQDHILVCGADCVGDPRLAINQTLAEGSESICLAEKNETCVVADCCPYCFGEIQQVTTCLLTYNNGTALCDTECACEDVPDWYDNDTYTCLWYAANAEINCAGFGNTPGQQGLTANEACCACKNLVNGTPVCDPECPCEDVPDWYDNNTYTCLWYAANAEINCAGFGNTPGQQGLTANEACCACKNLVNGTPVCDPECPCEDVPDWYDNDTYTCLWYAANAEKNCAGFGNTPGQQGLTANEACCACKNLVTSSAATITSVLALVGMAVSCMMM